MKVRRWLQRIALTMAPVAVFAGMVHAQGGGGVTVTGRVTNEGGTPLPGVNVFLQGLNIGTQTGDNGQYTFTVGANRVSGQSVALAARVIGYQPKTANITLTAGQTVTQDFVLVANPLRLGEVVVTGAGTSTTRERLTTSISTVDSSAITRAATPQNLVSALTSKAPGVEVRTQSGDPGASASIKIRGASSLSGTNQPLFVVDGQPIDNSTTATDADGTGSGSLGGTVSANRAADINPNDIESIDILKGSAAAAIYGARAANGVVLITTKRGRSGPTRYSFNSTETFDNIRKNLGLQRSYAQGERSVTTIAPDCGTDITQDPCSAYSWGAAIPAGMATYDHLGELFDTGITADNNLSISGGNDRTTFYASGGLTNQNGVVVGPNNKYNRLSVRLKGTQQATSTLNVGGNFNYIDTRGAYVQKGSNTSGLLLGGLRTPPTFNNKQFIDTVTGLSRSYRLPSPPAGSLTMARGYDDPFFTLNNNGNKSELGRAISNITADWNPLDWLTVKYTLGGDYYSEYRLETTPFTASNNPAGQIIRDDFLNLEIDHNLIATAKHDFSDNVNGTLTLGQNLNSRRNRSTFVLGTDFIAPAPYSLNNTTSYKPIELRSLAHIQAYFLQAELDLYNQLVLNAGVRDDGFSTFGASDRTALYPKASVAWTFTNALGNTDQKGMLSYGKLRLAYGQTGKEPPLYAAVASYSEGAIFSSGLGDFLNANQSGNGGITTPIAVGNPNLKPERQKELEWGTDFGFFDQKADLSFTAYDKRSSDVIIAVPKNAAATGYQTRYENAASVTNKGVEIELNARPYTTQNLAWEVGVQFARNHGNVNSLAGAEFVPYNVEGFNGSIGSSTVGFAPGVIRGSDFVRCGRGLKLSSGADVDSSCQASTPGYKKNALYLGANGLPIDDPTDRVIADPNPKYTMSYNTSLKVWNSWRVSALLDVRKGGQVWNGTRSAINRFGTGVETLDRSRTDGQFGKNFMTDVYPDVAGPGAGVAAFTTDTLWEKWYRGQGGSAGVTQAQYVEDGSFVKLREVSLTYTVPGSFLKQLGNGFFTSADLRFAGRNLHTWTRYKGLDPEANLQGAETLTQGIDFFNNPQTRSFVISLSLNR